MRPSPVRCFPLIAALACVRKRCSAKSDAFHPVLLVDAVPPGQEYLQGAAQVLMRGEEAHNMLAWRAPHRLDRCRTRYVCTTRVSHGMSAMRSDTQACHATTISIHAWCLLIRLYFVPDLGLQATS